MAAGGDLGILEGRTLALIHPAVMFFLFGATGWAGYLGWQHRRTRTIGEEISELKKALPAPAEGAAAPSTPEIDAMVAVCSPLQSRYPWVCQRQLGEPHPSYALVAMKSRVMVLPLDLPLH